MPGRESTRFYDVSVRKSPSRFAARSIRSMRNLSWQNTNCSVIRGFNSETVVCWTDYEEIRITDCARKVTKD